MDVGLGVQCALLFSTHEATFALGASGSTAYPTPAYLFKWWLASVITTTQVGRSQNPE